MIHYRVRCSREHEFDGWFNDSAAFEKQSKRGLVECPVCGDARVARALMAPSLSKRSTTVTVVENQSESPGRSIDAPAHRAIAGGRLPAHVRAILQHVRSEIERSCDYVGSEFAEEARKIHRGESDRRGIYGEATVEQTEALAEEGIEVGHIPWVPLPDS